MKIREATENDASGIAAVVHAMKQLQSVAPASAATTAERIEGNLRQAKSTGSSTIYVAETPDQALAGYCAVHWVPFLFLAGGEAYVTELFVCPADSGRGLGSRLLESVVQEARRRGCSRVSLLNGRDGESYGRGFYAKRGWVERAGMANFIFPLAENSR